MCPLSFITWFDCFGIVGLGFLIFVNPNEGKMIKSNIIKAVLMIALLGLSGCTKLFKKPGDELVKSPCDACKKAPFYINGKRV